jgi:hypothetical protein
MLQDTLPPNLKSLSVAPERPAMRKSTEWTGVLTSILPLQERTLKISLKNFNVQYSTDTLATALPMDCWAVKPTFADHGITFS